MPYVSFIFLLSQINATRTANQYLLQNPLPKPANEKKRKKKLDGCPKVIQRLNPFVCRRLCCTKGLSCSRLAGMSCLDVMDLDWQMFLMLYSLCTPGSIMQSQVRPAGRCSAMPVTLTDPAGDKSESFVLKALTTCAPQLFPMWT